MPEPVLLRDIAFLKDRIYIYLAQIAKKSYFVTIEYCRLNIEYLRYSFDFKKDGAKRHQQIFNLQSSIPACPG